MRRLTDAVGAFSLLPGGVRADRRALDDRAGVDGENTIGRDAHGETVHAAWGRATTLFTDTVVLRTVAGALEPLGGDAPVSYTQLTLPTNREV